MGSLGGNTIGMNTFVLPRTVCSEAECDGVEKPDAQGIACLVVIRPVLLIRGEPRRYRETHWIDHAPPPFDWQCPVKTRASKRGARDVARVQVQDSIEGMRACSVVQERGRCPGPIQECCLARWETLIGLFSGAECKESRRAARSTFAASLRRRSAPGCTGLDMPYYWCCHGSSG